MNEQIEEMAEEIVHNCNCGIFFSEAEMIARFLIERQGYRKQSESEWEKRIFIIFDSEKVGYRCSECNTTWDTPTPYCPNCGMKMKGGE
jgi:rubrerythrin